MIHTGQHSGSRRQVILRLPLLHRKRASCNLTIPKQTDAVLHSPQDVLDSLYSPRSTFHRTFFAVPAFLSDSPMKTPLTVVRGFLLFIAFSLSPSLAAAGESGCCVVADGSRLELHSPFFVFSLDTAEGLHAVAWENRLTGRDHFARPRFGIGCGRWAARRTASDAQLASGSVRLRPRNRRSEVRTRPFIWHLRSPRFRLRSYIDGTTRSPCCESSFRSPTLGERKSVC